MEWKNAPRQLPEPATAGKASEALAAAAFCAADGVKVLAGCTVMTPAANSMPSCAIARCKRFKVSRCTTLGLLRQHRQFEPHHQRVVGDLGHALKLEKWSSCPTCGTASTIFAAAVRNSDNCAPTAYVAPHPAYVTPDPGRCFGRQRVRELRAASDQQQPNLQHAA